MPVWADLRLRIKIALKTMPAIRGSGILDKGAKVTAIFLLGFCACLLPPNFSEARADEASSTGDDSQTYKKMSLGELMKQDVTSVSKQPEPYGQAPAAIDVITGDDIRRAGASSLPEALRLADNLEVAQKSAHDWGITARGFNTDLANKLLVLIDGRTVYTPLISGVVWSAQDYLLEDIDRIEVISGPGGTLWGENAVNGVINIITKSAKDTQGVYVEGGGGTQLQDFAGVRYGGVLASNVYFRVYGKYFDRSDEFFANGSAAPDSWSMGQGGFRIDAEPSSVNNFIVQGDYYSGDELLPGAGREGLMGGNLLSRWSHTFSADADLSLKVYYDRTHISEPVPPFVLGGATFAPAGILTDGLDTFDVDFQDRFALGERNRVVWGLGYRFTHDSVVNAPALAFFPTTLDQNLYSSFVQDEIKLMEKLSLTLGSKFEHNDYTGFELEPSARLSWTPVEGQSFWAAVSRAVRAPSRVDRDFSEADPPHLVVLKGDSGFVSEKLIAYELGYRAQLGPKVVTSVSTFYNVYDDVRSTSFTPTTLLPFYFANNLEGNTYGGELSANFQVNEWWRLRGSYNLLKEDLRVKPGQFDLNHALNETSDPQQQFSLRSSMNLPGNLELDGGLRWVDTLRLNNSGVVATVPSYFEAEVRLAWHPTAHLELAIVGQNLLHDHHPEYGIPGPTRDEIGRSVYAKVSFRW
jgi:iron complex outermembrane receptor protein